jgi:hypothetical protein
MSPLQHERFPVQHISLHAVPATTGSAVNASLGASEAAGSGTHPDVPASLDNGPSVWYASTVSTISLQQPEAAPEAGVAPHGVGLRRTASPGTLIGPLPYDVRPVFPWIEKTLPPVEKDSWARGSYGTLSGTLKVGVLFTPSASAPHSEVTGLIP